jgi:hypothetical protein
MLPHIPAAIHPAHRIERTFPQSAKLKLVGPNGLRTGHSQVSQSHFGEVTAAGFRG